MSYTECSDDEEPRPLPQCSEFHWYVPILTIVGVPEDGLRDVLNLIVKLAPSGKKYAIGNIQRGEINELHQFEFFF